MERPRDAYESARARMVEEQLARREVTDERVLAVMRRVPRHLFVEEALRDRAYGDHPLPIGEEQTISQPYIVGFMSQLLELSGQEKVLEVGTGSGYQTAVLAELARRVCSVERLPRLAERARPHDSNSAYRMPNSSNRPDGGSQRTFTFSTSERGGPLPSSRMNSSMTGRGPSARARTRPSLRFMTKPASPRLEPRRCA